MSASMVNTLFGIVSGARFGGVVRGAQPRAHTLDARHDAIAAKNPDGLEYLSQRELTPSFLASSYS